MVDVAGIANAPGVPGLRDDVRPVAWTGTALRVIDQTELPGRLVYRDIETVDGLVDAIRRLAVRGAPALGVAGAYGVVIALREAERAGWDETRLREEIGPWAVSGPALEIGRRALNDGAWLRTARDRVVADSARLDDFLREAGFEILGGTALFRLARHPTAFAFVQRLACQGIHVRSFGHSPEWLRFGLPADDEAFRRLVKALGV